jgi:hypothetical protein
MRQARVSVSAVEYQRAEILLILGYDSVPADALRRTVEAAAECRAQLDPPTALR